MSLQNHATVRVNDDTNLLRAIAVVRRAGYTVIEAPPLSPPDVDAIWREAEEYARNLRPGRAPR